jgi:hypothetical protein
MSFNPLVSAKAIFVAYTTVSKLYRSTVSDISQNIVTGKKNAFCILHPMKMFIVTSMGQKDFVR